MYAMSLEECSALLADSIKEAGNLVTVSGEYSSKCGYCRSPNSSVAFGLTAERLTVQAYQDLIDRGWRRSGTWLYLPVFEKTCCTCYTLRLQASKFIPDKSQRRVLRKFRSFLDGADTHQAKPQAAVGSQDSQKCGQRSGSNRSGSGTEAPKSVDAEKMQAVIQACVDDGYLPRGMQIPEVKIQLPKKKSLVNSGVALTSPVAFLLQAAARAKDATFSLTPQQLAELLALRLSDSMGCKVQAAGGHLNFHTPEMSGKASSWSMASWSGRADSGGDTVHRACSGDAIGVTNTGPRNQGGLGSPADREEQGGAEQLASISNQAGPHQAAEDGDGFAGAAVRPVL